MTVSLDAEKLVNKTHNPFTGGDQDRREGNLPILKMGVYKKSSAPTGFTTRAH